MSIVMPGIVANQQQLIFGAPALVDYSEFPDHVNGATSYSVAVPSGIQNGNLLIIAFGGATNGTAPTMSNTQGTLTTTGRLLRTGTLADMCSYLWYKVYNSDTDPTTFDFTHTGSGWYWNAISIAFSGADTYDTRGASTSTGGTVANGTPTAANANTLAVFWNSVLAEDANVANPQTLPSGYSVLMNSRDTSGPNWNDYRVHCGWQVYASAGALPAQTFTYSPVSTGTIQRNTGQTALFYKA